MQWHAIQFVSGGVSLLAFLAAAAVMAYRSKLLADSKLISTVPDDDRAELIAVKDGKLFRIDTGRLTRQQLYDLAVKEIQARADRVRIAAAVIVVLAFLAGGVAIALPRLSPDIPPARPSQETLADKEALAFYDKAQNAGDSGNWVKAFEDINSSIDKYHEAIAQGVGDIEDELEAAEEFLHHTIDELSRQGRTDLNHARRFEEEKNLTEASKLLNVAIRALQLVRAQKDTAVERDLARALCLHAAVLVDLGQPDDGVATADAALAIYNRLIGDDRTDELEAARAVCWTTRGNALYDSLRRDEAAVMFANASEVFRRLGNWGMLVMTLTRSGECYSVQDKHKQAEPFYLQAIGQSKKEVTDRNVKINEGVCHENLAIGYLAQRDVAKAESSLESALVAYRNLAGERIAQEIEEIQRLAGTVKGKLERNADVSTELEGMLNLLKTIRGKL